MPPHETQSEINGRKIAGLEAHMQHMNDTLSEVRDDIKILLDQGKEIAVIEERQQRQEGEINALKRDTEGLRDDVSALEVKTNKVLWTLGIAYAVVVFVVTMFADELKDLIFRK